METKGNKKKEKKQNQSQKVVESENKPVQPWWIDPVKKDEETLLLPKLKKVD